MPVCPALLLLFCGVGFIFARMGGAIFFLHKAQQKPGF